MKVITIQKLIRLMIPLEYNVLDKLDSKIRTYFPIILNYKGKV